MSLASPNLIRLHQGQAQVFYAPHRFKVVVAGRRWGKTELAKTECIDRAKFPHRRVWYIAPSYRMAKQIMWDQLKAAIPPRWIYKIHDTDLSIRLINAAMIECKGADDPDSLRGVGLDHVVLDEFQDMKEEVWKTVIRPTLAKSRGSATFIGTPKGYNNLYDVFQHGRDPTKRQWGSWQFRTIESPFIPEDEILNARLDMDPKSFRQEFEASFETMSGRVYHQFDRHIHVGNCPFNQHLPIWIGVDFNVDPMSAVVLQPQLNGEVWVVDEVYLHNSNTLEMAEEIERRYWRFQKQIVLYPDPAGGNRHSSRGESDLDVFREKGFRHIKHRRKHPLVSDRVNAVNRMFSDATGRVRLRVDARCKNVIQSAEQVLYKKGTSEIDKKLDNEHIMDALGYPIELEFPVRKIIVAGRSL